MRMGRPATFAGQCGAAMSGVRKMAAKLTDAVSRRIGI
jgi:hypothetical protein